LRIYARSRSLKSTDPGPAYLNDDNIIGLFQSLLHSELRKMLRWCVTVVQGHSMSSKLVPIMGGDSGGRGGGHVSPIIGVGDVNGIVPPPKFVVFVSTLNSKEYSSTSA